jgi:hypothetical protein
MRKHHRPKELPDKEVVERQDLGRAASASARSTAEKYRNETETSRC